MDELGTQAVAGLIGSGPLALAMGWALKVVWSKYQAALGDLREVEQDQLRWFRAALEGGKPPAPTTESTDGA